MDKNKRIKIKPFFIYELIIFTHSVTKKIFLISFPIVSGHLFLEFLSPPERDSRPPINIDSYLHSKRLCWGEDYALKFFVGDLVGDYFLSLHQTRHNVLLNSVK